jgi:LacI family transcriptional regulator
MSTLHDVAKRAGVAPTTARRALTEPDKLAKKTLDRVLKAIHELNYEPDQSAGALRRGQSRTIGFVVGDFFEPFFAQLIRTISKALSEQDYALMIADSEYDSAIELKSLRMFNGQRVSALLIRSTSGVGNLEYLKRMHEQGTFILEIDKVIDQSPFGHILLDNESCVREGVQYLHALGHRRIATLSTFNNRTLQDERTNAFLNVMAELELKLPRNYLHSSLMTEEGAYQRTLELMHLLRPPTAIFALTGNEAAGAFRAITKLNLKIPEDVSLLTFDNNSWTTLVQPPLDVIEQPVEAMGFEAVKVVVQAIHNRDQETVVRQRFPGKLIQRGSCAAPKSNQ